jgi:hypothetical protein
LAFSVDHWDDEVLNVRMKSVSLFAVVCAALVISGCGSHNAVKARDGAAVTGNLVTNVVPSDIVLTETPILTTNSSELIITPSNQLLGRVSAANLNLKFVVLTFPIGAIPGKDVRLNIYRQGLKVGEVKITGPQQDNNTVADLIAGNAQVGDEAR